MLYASGIYAVTIATTLSGVELIYKPVDSSARTITLEEAQERIKNGEADRVLVPVPEARLSAILARLEAFANVQDVTSNSLHELEEKVLSERAKFIQSTAARVLAMHHDLTDPASAAKRAVDLAEALDRELWQRLERG